MKNLMWKIVLGSAHAVAAVLMSLGLLTITVASGALAGPGRPVVVELHTSQGCIPARRRINCWANWRRAMMSSP